MHNIQIDIDYRERASGIIDSLQNRDGVVVNTVCLANGDYKVNNDWLVERKTLIDLAASIIDGRLFRQLSQYCFPYRKVLLIEGSAGMLCSSGIRRESIQGALVMVSLYFGIPVLRSMNPNETAALLIMMGRQWSKFRGVMNVSDMGSRPAHSKDPHRQTLNMLQCLPGVGSLKARALLQKFGSIEAVLLSTVEELAQTRGIGRKTAQSIKQMVTHSHARF
ncbi:ERCC4 domain-containing protein [Endozoicomonas sp. SCSIO W0465]|uniref:ERCC4 domain-containing protein n=1 Tax=Endozoicomonas sp. SCSIO W0465 TaxID=2918516 RepID=UPI00207601AA|nr:ERCC4 domain-containing protein [Endozoicomonas sp. SCSIO W0465]USE37035.1 helix-hairpin-helix domain-containing protein [Endozoicomonas sp. SCSIO W0465]